MSASLGQMLLALHTGLLAMVQAWQQQEQQQHQQRALADGVRRGLQALADQHVQQWQQRGGVCRAAMFAALARFEAAAALQAAAAAQQQQQEEDVEVC